MYETTVFSFDRFPQRYTSKSIKCLRTFAALGNVHRTHCPRVLVENRWLKTESRLHLRFQFLHSAARFR